MATKDKELLYISSEVFGLLVLENHWDRWLDIYKKYGSKIKDTRNKEKMTNIQPKYTKGGLRNSQNRDIRIGKRWSFQNINHLNELFTFVRQDREDHPSLTRDWLLKKRETMISNSRKGYINISQKDMHIRPYL